MLTYIMKQNRRGKMAPEDDDSRIDSFQKERDARIALLEKENFELRQEVLRLKAQISSLKAHDNERKSMLWKKLQNPNTDTSPQKQTDFVKTQEFQNLDGETFRPRPGFQELEAGKERSMKVPKPPPRHTSENKVQTPVAFPAPPPPPLPSKFLAGSKTVRRVPEVVELYRSLTRKDAHMENRSNTTAAPVIAFTRNMIGEIENRSTYLSAIKTDVKKQKEFINFLIKEVESAVFDQISEVEAFVKWLDGELSSLVDERAVLKHFPQWPERKADTLREAACNYRDLKNLEQEVSSFEDNQKESLPQATRKMQALQDRLEQRVNGMERMRESTGKKYRDFQIPCDWMMDSGLIGQMKVSSLRLAKEYMKRVSKELQSNECWREDNLMLQGVRFAYRVHQFAGGFDAETIQAFEELKKVGLSSHK
ncbi:protein CHUP1, chloroplastic isoform X3 [Citrus sinensis]|uniref:protein CHUP1, chloroplastic isoform X3 n=1 Tax=Citrus clementina TaxID=85681 RepID=UPI000CED1766|nr:protein CHUP1, chloroplastic isoform X3 [Citrus x clementina]XP_052287725.1 protein CHUP1, chloroplastic isoform X3 [Citrus sinensis]